MRCAKIFVLTGWLDPHWLGLGLFGLCWLGLCGFGGGFSAVARGEAPPSPWPWMPKELTLFITSGPNNPRNSEGDFLLLANGEILHIYTHYDGDSSEDHGSAHLASRRSADGGRTWSETDHVELGNEGKLNVMSVTCRRLADGTLGLFYLVKEDPADCRPYLRISTDEGSTWGPRIEIFREPSYNVVNNDRVIQLPCGRILVPCAQHARLGDGEYDYVRNAEIFCMASDDGGATWGKLGSVKNQGVTFQEPGLVELADGKILMTIRTDAGYQYFCYSDDSGTTWSEPFASVLDSPLSPALIKRIPGSDELLAVWNPRSPVETGRTAMNIARLSPDGLSILARKTLEHPERFVSDNWQYPSILFLADGDVLVAYFCWRTGLRIYRLNLADL